MTTAAHYLRNSSTTLFTETRHERQLLETKLRLLKADSLLVTIHCFFCHLHSLGGYLPALVKRFNTRVWNWTDPCLSTVSCFLFLAPQSSKVTQPFQAFFFIYSVGITIRTSTYTRQILVLCTLSHIILPRIWSRYYYFQITFEETGNSQW